MTLCQQSGVPDPNSNPNRNFNPNSNRNSNRNFNPNHQVVLNIGHINDIHLNKKLALLSRLTNQEWVYPTLILTVTVW